MHPPAWGAPPSTYHTSPTGRTGHGRPLSASTSSDSHSVPIKRRRESESADAGDDGRPLAITCTPCRGRKIKCDSGKPTCDNCSKNPQECVYPLKLKPGLRPGTGTDMMRRLEALEERVSIYGAQLAEHERRLDDAAWRGAGGVYAGDSDARLHVDVSTTHGGHTAFKPSAMADASVPGVQGPGMTTYGSGGAMGSLGGDMGSAGSTFPPSMSSMYALTDSPRLPGFSPIDLGASSHPSSSLEHAFGPLASPGGGSTTSFRDPQVLPPDDLVRDLIGLFYRHIHPWAPIVSPVLPAFAPPWNITVYAIVVVSLRLSADPRLKQTRQQYKAAAKQHIISHAIESTSVASAQALALLALDLIGSDQGPSSWGLLALLTRSAHHLGLMSEDDDGGGGGGGRSNSGASSAVPLASRAPAPSLSRTSIVPPPADWHDDEARRRLFWLIFCLDRYACVSTGWDFALADAEIKRRLPCTDELWTRTEWHRAPSFRPVQLRAPTDADLAATSPLAVLVEALDLLGRAHQLHARVVDPADAREIEDRRDTTVALTRAATRWMAALESTGGVPAGDAIGMGLVIRAIHHATLLKLNAYYAFPALSPGAPVEPFTSTCLASARAVVALCAAARAATWPTAASPLFIWACWVAARVLFVHAFLTHKDGPDTDFDAIVVALKEQAPYWSLANQYITLLERAKRKWQRALPSASAETATLPEAIHVLLDLRRTAYSAVGAGHAIAPTPPTVSPPDLAALEHLPAWAIEPLLGDLHNWFDLPAGLFADAM
ncbi:hypothetical protein Q5752_002191 [Cryptotrichosporon argae]